MKLGLITPIYKGGSRCEAKNYRPITLTSHLIKVFERVVAKKILEYLESKGLLNPAQHTFRKGRSCLSQLLQHYQQVLNIMEHGDSADVIYLDFSKAFDKVDHKILIHKLSTVGIRGRLLSWIKSFLDSRTQIVTVDGWLSNEEAVVSCV